MNLSGPELFMILLVVLLLFGVGRVSRIGGELGTAIREFRKGLAGDEDRKTLDEGDSEKVVASQRESQRVD